MKTQNYCLTLILLLAYQVAFSQNKFRVDYDIFTSYENGKWSEWEKANNTLVFNINDNGDILHYNPNGTKQTYRRVGSKHEGYTDSGEHYQLITILDEEGNEFILQYFDDAAIGTKLIFSSNLMLQVAQSN